MGNMSFETVRETPQVIQLRVAGGPILQNIPSIEWRRGDLSLAFSQFADYVHSRDLGVALVRIQETAGKEFISFQSPLKDTLKINAAQAHTIVAYFADQDGFFDEAGWLRETDADIPPAFDTMNGMPRLINNFMQEKVVPIIRKTSGHDADMRFIRLYPDPLDPKGVMLGMTMLNGCASCQTSMATTLKFAISSIQCTLFQPREEQTGGRRVNGFYILPSRTGSPSFTYRPPRHLIDSMEISPAYAGGKAAPVPAPVNH